MRRYKILKSFDLSLRHMPFELSWAIEHKGWRPDVVQRYLRGAYVMDLKEKDVATNKNKKFLTFTYKNDKGFDEIIRPVPELHCLKKLITGREGIKTVMANPKAEQVDGYIMNKSDFLSWVSLTGYPRPDEEYLIADNSFAEQCALQLVDRMNVLERVSYFPANDQAGISLGAAVAAVLDPFVKTRDNPQGRIVADDKSHLYTNQKNFSEALVSNRSGLQKSLGITGNVFEMSQTRGRKPIGPKL